MAKHEYRLTEWVLDELELLPHIKQLKKYGTSHEIVQQGEGFAVFIKTPENPITD